MCVIFTTLDVFLLDYCWNVLHDLPKPKLILVHPAVSPARRPRQIMNMEQCHCRILRRSLRKKLSLRVEVYFKSLTGSMKQFNLSQVPWMNKVNKWTQLIKSLLNISERDLANFHVYVVTLLVTKDSENSICLSDVMSLCFMLVYHLGMANNYSLEESIWQLCAEDRKDHRVCCGFSVGCCYNAMEHSPPHHPPIPLTHNWERWILDKLEFIPWRCRCPH